MAKEITNKHWLRKWLRGEPHITIGDEPRPYLKRWYIIPRNRFLNLYLHQFLRSDDDRALHDHPWWFVSILLRGNYTEHRIRTGWKHNTPYQVRRRAGTIAVRRADTAHRVELDSVERPVSSATATGLPFLHPRRARITAHAIKVDDYGFERTIIRYTERFEKPVWTVIVTGPKFREWGFLCPQGWKHWLDFDHDNGCGEA